MRRSKSYWQGLCCRTETDKSCIRSWFSPLCDEMEPLRADILCDAETDREKKIRAIMRDKDGTSREAIRTRGKTYSITLKPLTDARASILLQERER